jgi:hypothetical protein
MFGCIGRILLDKIPAGADPMGLESILANISGVLTGKTLLLSFIKEKSICLVEIVFLYWKAMGWNRTPGISKTATNARFYSGVLATQHFPERVESA